MGKKDKGKKSTSKPFEAEQFKDDMDLEGVPSASMQTLRLSNVNDNKHFAPAIHVNSKINTRRGKIKTGDNYIGGVININQVNPQQSVNEDKAHPLSQLLRENKEWVQHPNAKNTYCWQLQKETAYFTGRDTQIEQLNLSLGKQSTAKGVHIQAYGGMGKTALALCFANRNAKQFAMIAWVNAASNPLNECVDLVLADKQMSLDNSQDKEKLLNTAFGQWSKKGLVLIILDNAEDNAAIANLLMYAKSFPNIRFLITSRNNLNPLENIEKISLDNFEPKEAEEFIKKGLINVNNNNNAQSTEYEKLASTLAKELFYFPLSISHAISYLHNEPGIEKFIKAFRDRSSTSFIKTVFEKNKPLFQGEASEAAFTIFTMAYEKAEKENINISKVVKLCAYLGDTDIPERLIIKQLNNSVGEKDSVIYLLKRHALITPGKSKDTFVMHAMVQLVLRCYFEEKGFLNNTQDAIDLLDAEFHVKEETKENWEYWDLLEPHLPVLLSVPKTLLSYTRLFFHLAVFNYHHGHFDQAKLYIEKAITLTPSNESRSLMKYLLLQAEIAHQLGAWQVTQNFINNNIDYKDDEKLQLKIYKLAIGFYKNQGKFNKALEYVDSALSFGQRLYKDKDHDKYLDLLFIVTDVYAFAGKNDEKEKYLILMKNIIENNQEKIIFFSRVKFYQLYAKFYQDKQDFDTALDYANQAVKLCDEFHKKPNLQSWNCLLLLANVYIAKGDFKNAQETFAQCQTVAEVLFKSQDSLPLSLLAVYQADLLKSQEKYEEALILYLKSIEIAFKYYGDFPTRELAVRWHRIAAVYYAKKDYQAAFEACLKGYDIYKKMCDAVPVDEVFYLLRLLINALDQTTDNPGAIIPHIIELERIYESDVLNSIDKFYASIFIYHKHIKLNNDDKRSIFAVEIHKNMEALGDHIKQVPILQEIGHFYESETDYPQAKVYYQKVCENIEANKTSDMDKKTAWTHYARICNLTKDYEEALKAYKNVWRYTQKYQRDAKKEVTTIIDQIIHFHQKTQEWDSLYNFITMENMGATNPKMAGSLLAYFFRLTAEKLFENIQYSLAIKFYDQYFSVMNNADLTDQEKSKNNIKTQYALFMSKRNLLEACNKIGDYKRVEQLLDEVLMQSQMENFIPNEDSYENAKRNLYVLCTELGIDAEFDETHTCILGVDNEFSIHFTFEPNSKRLYVYSPLLDGLPEDLDVRFKLYEYLLERSMLGGKMLGGGVGLAEKEELVLYHIYLDMEKASPFVLMGLSSIYASVVEKMRADCKMILQAQVPLEPEKKPTEKVVNYTLGLDDWFKECAEYVLKFPRDVAKKFSDKIFQLRFDQMQPVRDGFEEAKRQLSEFGENLALDNLHFDENNSCILGIDNAFSLHITYEPLLARLYIYSPLLEAFPADKFTLFKLYEILLQDAMLGGRMVGGGVGIAVKEEIIIMHVSFNVLQSAQTLLNFSSLFVETVQKQRMNCQMILNESFSGEHEESVEDLEIAPPYLPDDIADDEKSRTDLILLSDKVLKLEEQKKDNPLTANSLLKMAIISVRLKNYTAAKSYIDSVDALTRQDSSAQVYALTSSDEVASLGAWVYCNAALALISIVDLQRARQYLSKLIRFEQYLFKATQKFGTECLLKLQVETQLIKDNIEIKFIIADVLVALKQYAFAFTGYANHVTLIDKQSTHYKCYQKALANLSQAELKNEYDGIAKRNLFLFMKTIWLDYPKEANPEIAQYIANELLVLLQEHPNESELYKSLAQFYISIFDLKSANVCYERLIAQNISLDSQEYYTLACILAINNNAQAESYYQKAVEVQKSQQALIYYSNFLYSQGRYSEALTYLGQLIDLAMSQDQRCLINYRKFELPLLDKMLKQLLEDSGKYTVDTAILAYYLFINCHLKRNDTATARLTFDALKMQVQEDKENPLNQKILEQASKSFEL